VLLKLAQQRRQLVRGHKELHIRLLVHVPVKYLSAGQEWVEGGGVRGISSGLPMQARW
jgi:hypothetical protein